MLKRREIACLLVGWCLGIGYHLVATNNNYGWVLLAAGAIWFVALVLEGVI